MTTNESSMRAPMSIPRWLDRGANWSWRLILIGSAAFLALYAISYIRIAVVPALIAIIFASALRPATSRLCTFGLPPVVATAAPILLVLTMFVGAGWFVTQRTAAELSNENLPTEQVRLEIEEWLRDGPLEMTRDEIDEAEEAVRDTLIGGTRAWGASRGGMILSILGGGVLTLVLTFLFVKDGPQMWQWAVDRVAPERRDRIDDGGRAAAATMAAYIRSVVLTGFIDALLIGAGLFLLDVPMVVPLMIVTFVAALFPVVGAVVAGLAAALVALITVDPATALWVVVLTLVVQQIEGNVLMPMLIGRRVAVHPAIVLLALTSGGAIAGLTGAFLAVPVIAGLISAMAAFATVGPPRAAGANEADL